METMKKSLCVVIISAMMPAFLSAGTTPSSASKTLTPAQIVERERQEKERKKQQALYDLYKIPKKEATPAKKGTQVSRQAWPKTEQPTPSKKAPAPVVQPLPMTPPLLLENVGAPGASMQPLPMSAPLAPVSPNSVSSKSGMSTEETRRYIMQQLMQVREDRQRQRDKEQEMKQRQRDNETLKRLKADQNRAAKLDGRPDLVAVKHEFIDQWRSPLARRVSQEEQLAELDLPMAVMVGQHIIKVPAALVDSAPAAYIPPTPGTVIESIPL